MPNRSYQIGYRFECRVREYFRKQGYVIIRQHFSAFPDLIAMSPNFPAFFVECKVRKYLNREEKEKAREFVRQGYHFVVAYRKNRKLLFYSIGGDKIESRHNES
jgi:Holliday junction resolvase